MGKVIDVDEELYNGISSEISGLATTLEGSKSKLDPCFSGELASFYSGSCNTDLGSEVANSITKIENLSLAIDASINAYKNTDEDLAYGLDALIDELFSNDFRIINGASDDGSSGTLEEREQYLKNLIESYETLLRELEDEFNEKYGAGLPYNSQDFKYVYPILYAMGFNVIDLSKFDKTGRMTYESMKEIISFCDEQKVFERTIDYLNGGKYKDTIGKIDFGDGMFDDPNNTEEDWNEAEIEFLRRVASCYSRNISNNPGDLESSKALVISLLVEDGIITLSGDNKYKFSNLNFIDSGREHIAIYDKYVQDIQSLSDTIYNYKQALELMPFQSYFDDEDFKDFYNNEFQKIKDEYLKKFDGEKLTDEEIALYAYLAKNESQETADKYLKAMQDTINCRKGMEDAIQYILDRQAQGFDVGDILATLLKGFGDGVSGFIAGIGQLFNPTNKVRSEQDYMRAYLIEILSNPEKYKDYINISLTDAERTSLKAIYNVFYGVGNMFIPQAISLAGMGLAVISKNPLIAKICSGISSVLLAASVTGNSAKEALADGHDLLHAYLYGALSGASEALFEKLGGIFGIGDNVNLSSLWGFIVSILKEGAEEFSQEYFDAGLRAIILGEVFDLGEVTKSALISGLYGMAVAGVMNVNSIITIKIAGKIYKIRYGDLANTDFNETNTEEEIKQLLDSKNQISQWHTEIESFIENKLRDILLKNFPEELVNKLDLSKIKVFESADEFAAYCKKLGAPDSLEHYKQCGGLHCPNGEILINLSGPGISSVADILGNIVHENIHELGNIFKNSSDFSVKQLEGFNEAITEWLNLECGITDEDGNYYDYNAYPDGVYAIRAIIAMGIPGLSKSDFENAFFNENSVSKLEAAMDGLMGEGYFKKFIKALSKKNNREEIKGMLIEIQNKKK